MQKKLTAFLLVLAFQAQAFEPFQAHDIRVEGAQRISDGTVFSYLPIEEGDEITVDNVQDSIRALYKTGFFDQVQFEREGDILVIRLVERPAISDIDISGNKDIKTEDLMKALDQIGLTEGEIFNRLQLERVEGELIRQYYSRGKYNVKINTTVKDLPRNRVKITIVVSEGKAARIKHLNIVGNEAFSDEELLKDFESDTTNWTSWYSSDDQYSKDKVSGDLEKLRSFYQDRGYVDFSIESTQVSMSPDKKDMYLTINIREGDIYTVSGVDLAGELVLEEEKIRQLLLIREGDIFSKKRLEASSKNIKAVLSNLGYAFADVLEVPELDKENKTVRLKLIVNPGKRVMVRRIVFKGNARTFDEVLRRDMRQFEGAWFSQAAIDRSKIRLQRTGFFQDVNIETPRVPGTDDQVDVIVTVEEANAGNFNFGVGYSQVGGVVFSVSLTQRNFLGTGKEMNISANNSTLYRRFTLSYTNPYFTDDGVSLGYVLSYRETDQSELNITSYTTDTMLAGLTTSVPLTETDRIRFGLMFERTKVYATQGFTSGYIIDYLCNLNGIDAATCEETASLTGEFDTIRLETGWARDSRNGFFRPTRGTFQRLGAEVSLPGSTINYYKIDYRNKTYFTPAEDWTFMLGGRIAYGDTYGDSGTDLYPFYENFYAGGNRSVRGYRANTLGPRDENNDPIGGAFVTTGSLELMLPIPFLKEQKTTRVAWFVDVGNVYRNIDSFDAGELRYTTGISVRWNSPVAPIEISYGYPLNDQDGDQVESLQFSFGNVF